MNHFSWDITMADFETTTLSDGSDDEFAMNVMDDISVPAEDDFARPVFDSDLRNGSNQSPVCVAGFFDTSSSENPVDHADGRLGGEWVNEKIATGVSMDTDDDADDEMAPLPVDDFVNFDNFDDAVFQLCEREPMKGHSDLLAPGMYSSLAPRISKIEPDPTLTTLYSPFPMQWSLLPSPCEERRHPSLARRSP